MINFWHKKYLDLLLPILFLSLSITYALLYSDYSPDFETYAQHIEFEGESRVEELSEIRPRFEQLFSNKSIEYRAIFDINKNDYLFSKVYGTTIHFDNYFAKLLIYIILVVFINLLIIFWGWSLLGYELKLPILFTLLIFCTVPKNHLMLLSIYPYSTALLSAVFIMLIFYNKFLNIDFSFPYLYVYFLLFLIFLRRIDILIELFFALIIFMFLVFYKKTYNYLKIIFTFLFVNALLILISIKFLNSSKNTVFAAVKGQLDFNDTKTIFRDQGNMVSEANPSNNYILSLANFVLKTTKQNAGIIDQFHFVIIETDLLRTVTILFLLFFVIFNIIALIKNFHFNFSLLSINIFITGFLTYLLISFSKADGSVKINYLYFPIFLLIFSMFLEFPQGKLKLLLNKYLSIFASTMFLEFILVVYYENFQLKFSLKDLFLNLFFGFTFVLVNFLFAKKLFLDLDRQFNLQSN